MFQTRKKQHGKQIPIKQINTHIPIHISSMSVQSRRNRISTDIFPDKFFEREEKRENEMIN